MKRSILVIIILSGAAVVVGQYFIRTWHAPGVQVVPDAPMTVTATLAKNVEWRPHLQVVGTLRAHWGASLSFQTDGLVSHIGFHSGQRVKDGDVLAKLQLNDEPGLFAKYSAQADLDLINLNRDRAQFEAHAISRAVVDHDRLTLAADRAQRDAEQALIAMKTLTAPFSGRLGIRRIDPGQYLRAGSEVVTLQAIDPIYVDFFVPQRFSTVIHDGADVTVSVDSSPNNAVKGKVTATTPAIDIASRTLMVRATIQNADEHLLPGAFASVDLAYGATKNLVTIPKAAINYHPYGSTVFIVVWANHDKPVARERLVVTGEARGDLISVTSGVSAGDTVVTSGQMKLRDNEVIRITTVGKPGENITPILPEE